jgi:hypothetical protein
MRCTKPLEPPGLVISITKIIDWWSLVGGTHVSGGKRNRVIRTHWTVRLSGTVTTSSPANFRTPRWPDQANAACKAKGRWGGWPAIPPLVLLSRRARSQDHQRPGPTYFPVEVAQRYLDEISRDIPAKLLLLSAKFAVELADLERRMAPRKPLPATWQAGFAARDSH